MLLLIAVILFIAILAFIGICDIRLIAKLTQRVAEGNAALTATEQDCDNGEALADWIDAHPDEDISHPEYQKLLRCKIGSYMRFLETHPDYNGKHHLDFLVSQLIDDDRTFE